MIQLQFINFLLKTKDKSLISLNNLNEDYFSDYRAEYRFIENHIEKYDRIPDTETFLDKFRDFDIVEVNESESYLITALIDDYNTRQLQYTFNKISPLIQAGRVDDAIDIFKNTATQINTGVSFKSIDILRDTTRFDEYVERTKNHSQYFFSTGFKELDAIIGGIDRTEDIVVVVARPGIGKSLVSLKMAIAAAQEGLKVGLYSGEMSVSKVGNRADTMIGHINNGGITHGNEIFLEQYKEYMRKLPDMFEGQIRVITPDMIDGIADVNTLKVFIEKENLDVLVVDQISLLEERKGRTEAEQTANIMKQLKYLQTLERIPMIVVSQQNREKNEGGELDLTQVAGSDKVGRYATVVLFLEKKDNIMKIHIVKSRDNASGQTLSYEVDINKGYYVFIPEDGQQVSEEIVNSYKKDDTSDGDYF